MKETAICILQPPQGVAAVPLILDSPHSGSQYPTDFNFALPLQTLRRSEDAFVEELYAPVLAQGGHLLHALFPRCYIDPNRSLEDLDPALLSDPWPGAINDSAKVRRGAGLIWRNVKKYGNVYDHLLTAAEVQARIDRCWHPYHHAIAQLLDDASAQHGHFIHINCHSMASYGDHTTEDGPVRRPDFVLGDRDGTTCAPLVTNTVVDVLRSQGYSVSVNDPYKGVELVRRYSDPANGRHSLQIELNRALYLNEDSIEKAAGFAQLQANLAVMTGELISLLQRL